MAWTCPQCGVDQNREGTRRCEACGYVIYGTLSLTAEATGRQVSIAIDTDVGRHLLRSFAGDEARYASDPQFRVSKDPALGAWAITACPGATNPTWLDGRPLRSAPTPLPDGGVVSIGPERARLKIRIVG